VFSTKFKNLAKSIGSFDILIISALIWFLGKFLRYVFPPLFESLQGTYAVSTTALGWTFSIFLFAYALVQFPSGLLSDRFGGVWVIVGGVTLSSLGALIFILNLPFSLFVVLMAILGIGTGVHKTSAVKLLYTIYPSKKGRALGIFDTFGTFGGVIAPVAVIAAAAVSVSVPGWRLLLFSTGAFGLFLTFIFIKRVPNKFTKKEKRKTNDNNNKINKNDKSLVFRLKSAVSVYGSLFESKKFIIFVIAAILFSFTYNGIVAFLPLYLTQEVGISSGYASLFYSVLFIASVAQIASGELSDQIGTLPVMSGALTLCTLSFIIFMMSTNSGLVFLGISVLCIGLGAHSFRPVRGAYLMDSLPDNISAGGLGIVRTLLMGSGAISPGIVGTVSGFASFRIAFWMLATSVGMAALSVIILNFIKK